MKNRFFKVICSLLLVVFFVLITSSCHPNTDNPPVVPPAVNTYSVTIKDVEGGSVVASETTVDEGESVTLTVFPDANYELSVLKVNNNEITVSNNQAVVDNVNEDLTVLATFIGVEVEISFVVEDSISQTIKRRYNETYGDLPTPSLPANLEFIGWYTEKNGQVSGKSPSKECRFEKKCHSFASPIKNVLLMTEQEQAKRGTSLLFSCLFKIERK